MKTLFPFLLLSFVFLTFFSNKALSQPSHNERGCCTILDTNALMLKSSSCNNSSTAYNDKYRTPAHWTPNNYTPIKTILINIVVCLKSDGTGGWVDSQEFRDDVDTMFVKVNQIFTHPQQKGYNLTCEPTINYITDTKIRFELNEIIFLEDDFLHYLHEYHPDSTYQTNPIIDTLHKYHPNSKNALNYLFTATPNNIYPGHWGFYHNYNNSSYINTSRSMWDPWHISFPSHIIHIAHELGHAVGLHHMYDTEYRNINHFDFLDDVFGTCPEPLMMNSQNPCFDDCGNDGPCTCNPPANQICYLLYPCFLQHQNPPYAIMSNTGTEDYISPKQAGRMHRALSLFENGYRVDNRNMHKYVKETTPYHIPYEVNENETWDFAIKKYQNIVVKSGYTLTIKCKVLMPVGGKIIVEPSATLIIDGGIITNFPHIEQDGNSLWQGIEVWGNSNQPQTPFSGQPVMQGKVILKNGAVIENAHNAVRLLNPDDFHTTGGIVIAEDATFRNNGRAVEFIAYENFVPGQKNNVLNNISYFKNTKFIIDEDLNLAPNHIHFVTMWKVRGVKFDGCEFINNSFSLNDGEITAIKSIDASYRINSYCSSPSTLVNCPSQDIVQSKFENLTSGVNALGTVEYYPVSIMNSEFRNCVYPVRIDNTDDVKIVYNSFINSYIPAWSISGVHIRESTGYVVEENYFDMGINSHAGIYLYNTGSDENRIYRNTFNNNNRSTVAYGYNHLNSSHTVAKGLKFICNNYEASTNADIEISVSNTVQIEAYGAGIIQAIRHPNKTVSPAGNHFTQDGSVLNYNNGASSHQVLYFQSIQSPNPPNNVNNLIEFPLGDEDDCPIGNWNSPPRFENVSNLELEFSKFRGRNTDYLDAQYLYYTTIDNGDSEGLILSIQTAMSQTAIQLKDEMIEASPLSFETLMELIESNKLSNGLLYEVFSHNPGMVRMDEILYALINKTDPMPQYMLTALIEEALPANFKDSLEIDIAFFGQQRKMHFDRLLAHYLELEDANDFDSLNSLLQSFAVNFHGKARYIKHLVSAGKMSNAADYITAWHGIDYQNDELTSERENFTDFVTDYISNFYEDNLPTWPTSEGYFSSLESLVESNIYGVSCKADNILHFNSMTEHPPVIAAFERGGRASLFNELKLVSAFEKIELPNGEIKIYPNPSSGNFTLAYSTQKDALKLHYEILTMKGVLIQKGNLLRGNNALYVEKKGTFVMNIIENEVKVASYKIVIR